MPPLPEYAYRIKRFYRFWPKEIGELIISILVISFVWAFDDGAPVFQWSHWTANFLKTLFVVALTFLVHVSGQKLVGLWHGYRIEYHLWGTGLLISFIIALISAGKIAILLPGGVLIYHMAKQRLGEFRYGLNFFEAGLSATAGPVVNVLFAMFVKTIQWIINSHSSIFNELYLFNLVFAVYMMLPLPGLPGIVMFWASRLTYVFFFAAILSYILLVYLFGFYSLIWAVILGALLWLLYLWNVEN